MQTGIGIVNVLDFLLPAFVFVDFVQKQVGAAMRVVVFRQFKQGVVGKPDVVQRSVQSLFRLRKGALDVLQHQGCLAHAFRSLDDNQSVVPVDFVVKVSSET